MFVSQVKVNPQNSCHENKKSFKPPNSIEHEYKYLDNIHSSELRVKGNKPGINTNFTKDFTF